MSEVEEFKQKRDFLSQNWKEIREKISGSYDFIDGILLALFGGVFAAFFVMLLTEVLNLVGPIYSFIVRFFLMVGFGYLFVKIANFHEARLRKLTESEKSAAKQHNDAERDLSMATLREQQKK